MNALGTHLLLELHACDPQALNDLSLIREILIGAAERVGATVVGHSFHQFSPQGVTGVVSIAESHICIHTWPEYGYAAMDIFTCGEGFKLQAAVDLIVKSLGSKEHSVTEIRRGVLSDLVSVTAR